MRIFSKYRAIWNSSELRINQIIHTSSRSIFPYYPNIVFFKRFYSSPSVESVRELRKITGVSIGRCNQALKACSGDIEKARIWIRESGISISNNLLTRTASEGLVAMKFSSKSVVLIELACETDFVAKSDIFITVLSTILNEISNQQDESERALKLHDIENIYISEKVLPLISSNKISEVLSEISNIFNERVYISRLITSSFRNNCIPSGYIHNVISENIGTSASFITISSDQDYSLNLKTHPALDLIKFCSHHIAMQINANPPQYLDKSQISKDVIEQEIKILNSRYTDMESQKAKKIINHQMNKFCDEISLNSQEYLLRDQLLSHLSQRQKTFGNFYEFIEKTQEIKVHQLFNAINDNFLVSTQISEFGHLGIKKGIIHSIYKSHDDRPSSY